uniref:Ninjurin 1 n=2 Tax=Cyprinus carpio TaxID=7962 RepID=A0A9J7ZSF2_CYPCA
MLSCATVYILLFSYCFIRFRRTQRKKQQSDRPQQSHWSRNTPMNMNHYANKKSAAESMLDIALLMANASQLKTILELGPTFSFYIPLISLISISLILQITVGVLLIFIVKWNLNDSSKHYILNLLENVVTALVFVIVVINVFITAFGVQRPEDTKS